MRRTFTAEEKASVFELWKNGTGFSEIANILGSKPGTIFTMLRDTGGIKPHERKRAVAHLTLSEREEIRAGLSAKMSIRAIATALNRSPSTISREVQRNRGRRYYKAVDANNRANRMAKRPKPCLLDQNLPLRKLVLEKLEMKWSPEQILNRPGFPGECFICELRLPDHRFRWKHNKLFLLLPEEYGPAFPAIVDCYTSPPT
ncbi:putative integrase protein [Streptococcus pneumoniae]|nr:putative integrase protein [Streptococcus pneumoniae]